MLLLAFLFLAFLVTPVRLVAVQALFMSTGFLGSLLAALGASFPFSA